MKARARDKSCVFRYTSMGEIARSGPYGLQNEVPPRVGDQIPLKHPRHRGNRLYPNEVTRMCHYYSDWHLTELWHGEGSRASADGHTAQIQGGFRSGDNEFQSETSGAGQVFKKVVLKSGRNLVKGIFCVYGRD